MKRILFISLCFMFISISLFSQDKAQRENKVKAQRIAFITEKLNLTPEEAQKFWPVFNAYEEEKQMMSKSFKNVETPSENMTEEEAMASLQSNFSKKEAELELSKSYVDKFKNAIPVYKIAQLYTLDKAFKDRVLKSIKNKMDHKNRGRYKGNGRL